MRSTSFSSSRCAHSLGTLARSASQVEGVRKSELHPGDRVLVTTRNSVYCIRYLGGDLYAVSGGWFAQRGLAPAEISIAGCTYGGRALLTGMLAARGLFLEFGNAVTTTRIQRVEVIPRDELEN